MGGREADGAVHGDVLRGAICCMDPHVELQGEKATRGQNIGVLLAAQQAGLLFFFFLTSICRNLRSITYVSSQLDNAPLSKALINRAGDVYRPEQEE